MILQFIVSMGATADTLSSKHAILFDMDGVLVKSDEVWFRVVEAAGEHFSAPQRITREAFMPTFGQGTAADIAFFGLGCTVAELDAFYAARFVDHLDSVWVNPEAAPVLQALAERGVARALVTNTVGPLAEAIINAAGLSPYFDVRATADRVKAAKPAPDLIILACHELGVTPARAAMVGDSKYDRQAAMSAGVLFVGFGGIRGDVSLTSLYGLLAQA